MYRAIWPTALTLGLLLNGWSLAGEPAAPTGGFIRGVGYSPWHATHQWNLTPEDRAVDIQLMKQLHINAVRTWGPTKREGVDFFYSQGLRMLPQLGHAGQGLASQYLDGTPARNPAFANPELAAQLRQKGHELAAAVQGHPGLIGFLLGNEYSFVAPHPQTKEYQYAAFDAVTAARYRDHLRQRFGDIETWNRLTGEHQPDFAALQPPAGKVEGPQYYEWLRFLRASFNDFLQAGWEGVREVDRQTPVSYALLCGNRWDPATEDADLDFLELQGDNLYWHWDRDWVKCGVRLCRRIGPDRPILVTEFGYTTASREAGGDWTQKRLEKPEWQKETEERAARLMTQNLWFFALHPQVKGTFPFEFNDEWYKGGDKNRLDHSEDSFGLVTADRKIVKQVGQAVGRAYAEFERLDQFMATRRAPVEVLVSDRYLDWHSGAEGDLTEADACGQLYRHGVSFNLVSLLSPAGLARTGCRKLILLDQLIPSDPDGHSQAADALRQFQAEGGQILYLGRRPCRTVYGAETGITPHEEPTRALWNRIEDFMGARPAAVVSQDNSEVLWRVLDSAAGRFLLVLATGEHPVSRVEVRGLAAQALASGDGAELVDGSAAGFALTNINVYALVKLAE